MNMLTHPEDVFLQTPPLCHLTFADEDANSSPDFHQRTCFSSPPPDFTKKSSSDNDSSDSLAELSALGNSIVAHIVHQSQRSEKLGVSIVV